MKKQEFKNNEDRLRNLWDNFKYSNIQIIGVPEGKEELEMENLFEKIMKENFPNLVKEPDMKVSPGSSQSPKEFESKEKHMKTHHN